MALTDRQKLLYGHTLTIVRPSRASNVGGATPGKPGAETYAIVTSSVPCLYKFTPNIDDVFDAAGRGKRNTVLTNDIVHMESPVDVRDTDLLRNETILPNGSKSELFGTYHRVLGAPTVIESAGRRTANKQSVMALSEEKPPTAVLALFP